MYRREGRRRLEKKTSSLGPGGGKDATRARFLVALEHQGSAACRVFGPFRLHRGVVGGNIRSFRLSRVHQATLRSIFCAARFKFFGKSALLPEVSQRGETGGAACGEIDSKERLLECAGLGMPPDGPDHHTR